MSQIQAAQQQYGMKFGLIQEDKKSLMHLIGSVPAYFEKVPSAVGGLIVESMRDLDTFKTSIPKKYIILALYTQSLTLRDEYKQILYEKLLNMFGVTQEERFFVIESISLFNTLAIFERMTMILTSKDAFEQNNRNAIEYFKKINNQANSYDHTAINRSQNIDYGMSPQHEDQCILQFGTIPLCFNKIPRVFSDNLWKKWMMLGQVDIPMKIRFLILAIIYGTTSIKTSYEKDAIINFLKLAFISGLTEQELIEIAAIQAFRNETTIWMISTHFTLEEFAKTVDVLAGVISEHLKNNKDI